MGGLTRSDNAGSVGSVGLGGSSDGIRGRRGRERHLWGESGRMGHDAGSRGGGTLRGAVMPQLLSVAVLLGVVVTVGATAILMDSVGVMG